MLHRCGLKHKACGIQVARAQAQQRVTTSLDHPMNVVDPMLAAQLALR
jgi:hypothetical protein